MFYQPSALPPLVTVAKSENESCKTLLNTISTNKKNKVIAGTVATPTPPENLPPEFSSDGSEYSCDKISINETLNNQDIIVSKSKNLTDIGEDLPDIQESQPQQSYFSRDINYISDDIKQDDLNFTFPESNRIKNTMILPTATALAIPQDASNNYITDTVADVNTESVIVADLPTQPTNNLVAQEDKASIPKDNHSVPNLPADNILAAAKTLLVGVFINEKEVGSLEIIKEDNSLLIPLDSFAQITGLELDKTDNKTQIKTPLGVVTITETDLKKIDGINYISDTFLKEKLLTTLELKTSDLALNIDLPWRRGSGQSRNQAIDLKPEVRPPSSGLSNLRQELNYFSSSGDSSWRSSTLLGGRLGGGAWRLRLDNNFINQPELSEYFYFKRSGRLLYQVGRQQLSLNPVLSGLNLTGLQFGYTNLPADRFNTNYSASELFPRRSQPTQAFRGVVPPASFVQLRVGGVVFAQQQVGLSGEYDFQDILLPIGQTSEIELLVYDRNNLNIPIEVRSLSLNSSDLLLPSGGNVQLAGLGVTGNWLQNTLFDDISSTQAGKFAGFYQVRQGISDNLTLEAGVQVLPETTQAQAGFAWRLASPLILSANVGTSSGELAYRADLDFQLDKWRILGTSELYPQRYFSGVSSNGGRDRNNHSLDVSYKFNNNFTLGFVARSYQNQNINSNYILPTFSFRPAANLSFRSTPSYDGDYVFNASYQPTRNTRLLFNAYSNVYTSDFSYNLNREYRLSLGTESGGDLATRYTLVLGRTAPTLSGLSWRVGLGYREGEIGPFVGASMRVLPGLFLSLDYQGIPSRNRNFVGGFGDDRLTISLVSDLSFAGGRVAPSEYSSIGRDTGAISGRIVVEGGRNGADLSGGLIQVYNNRGRQVGGGRIDSEGNFFVGNLREGNYIVQLDPDELPIELNVRKSSIVAEVAGAAVTQLNFPVNLEYGMAGRITDVAGQPIPEVEIQLINAEGKQVATTTTDQFGLYRLDGIPVGKYTLRVPKQEGINITSTQTLPQLDVAVTKEFVYDQNLQLPISAAVKQAPEKSDTPNP
ncbi:carboxypeptidase regulatory-like domain-containing protein [Nostoc sp. TCL26-01]|uniref:carboxypeptidase regulatory-like domain-containing protein n=1 Tax=Nostoc sp. TCL26-01 TaxID=2576904 RepID=UPI0015C0A38A|nr:carboxypeptidase regulatory-like domain-containing protein [Nostoc sp. TCL26-01]QLE54143.1 Cna B-type [Nostoc sp. TCL26-01]